MSDEKLPLTAHLDELRRRLIICLIAVGAFSIPCYLLTKHILRFLAKSVGKLVFIGPHEAFFAYLKLAFFGGIFLSLPIILWQTWKFISVGLKENERKYLSLYGFLSFLFFILGAAFAYLLILPIGMKFFLGFATDTLHPMISISKYISFVGLLLLGFGIVFELPLVILFLTKIGLVTPQSLAKKRKYAILLTFIFAAIITPPDVFTQFLMAIPVLLLYEGSIWVSKLMSIRRQAGT